MDQQKLLGRPLKVYYCPPRPGDVWPPDAGDRFLKKPGIILNIISLTYIYIAHTIYPIITMISCDTYHYICTCMNHIIEYCFFSSNKLINKPIDQFIMFCFCFCFCFCFFVFFFLQREQMPTNHRLNQMISRI